MASGGYSSRLLEERSLMPNLRQFGDANDLGDLWRLRSSLRSPAWRWSDRRRV